MSAGYPPIDVLKLILVTAGDTQPPVRVSERNEALGVNPAIIEAIAKKGKEKDWEPRRALIRVGIP